MNRIFIPYYSLYKSESYEDKEPCGLVNLDLVREFGVKRYNQNGVFFFVNAVFDKAIHDSENNDHACRISPWFCHQEEAYAYLCKDILHLIPAKNPTKQEENIDG